MPSPFPGMDPWLEGSLFGDLHAALTIYLREALNAALPAGYMALGNHLVWVDDTATRLPDTGVFGPDHAAGSSDTAVLPGLVTLGTGRTPEDREQPYLEILTTAGRRLVTAVEVLSPANKKKGAGRTAYQDKQEEFRLGGVNLVEIDLLRTGSHTTAVPLTTLRRKAGASEYHVSVRVASAPAQYFAAALRLADRLPAFGIPLDPGVAPVVVDLQPLLDRAYDTGRYAHAVDYRRDPAPPLAPEQRAWANAVLKERGLLP